MVSLEMERRLQAAMLDSIGPRGDTLRHDVSDGGLLIALAESALYGGRGYVAPHRRAGQPRGVLLRRVTGAVIVKRRSSARA